MWIVLPTFNKLKEQVSHTYSLGIDSLSGGG